MAGIAVFVGSVALAMVAGCGAARPNDAAVESTPSASSAASAAPLALASGAPIAPPTGVASAPNAAATASAVAVSPTASATASTAPLASGLVPASATFEDPSFDGGDVPKAKASIEKLKKAVEKCVNDGGGVPKDGAS